MLNTDRLAELKSDVGEDDFEEVVQLFCEEVEQALDELSTAQPEQCAQKLHFLKGCAANIGFDALATLCSEKEKVAPDAILDITEIETVFAASRAALAAT